MQEKEQNEGYVKQDINFLEYPIWTIAKRSAQKKYTIKNKNGTFQLSTSADRLPDRTDKIILYYLLLGKKKTVKTTRHKIIKDIFNFSTPTLYKRLETAIRRLTSLYIEFNGTFYEGNKYTKRGFHLIEGWKLNENSGELIIYIDKQYFEFLEKTQFFKFINFDEYKRLKKPTSSRLYEILIKTFKDRVIWEIGIIKLAEKMTIEQRYPAKILPYISSAVKEINLRSNLKVKFIYKKERRVCVFVKVQEYETKQLAKEHKELISLLPESAKKDSQFHNLISKYHHLKGVEYTKSNIEYSVKNAQQNLYRFLKSSLKNDWAKEYREKQKAEQELLFEETEREKEERAKEKLREKIIDIYEKLGPKKKEKYIQKAIESIPDNVKENKEVWGTIKDMYIREMTYKLIKEDYGLG